MESTPDNFAKKFMNTLVRHKKIVDFESSVPASFKIIMAIKNREQRLISLLQLQKNIEKDIDEIVMLSDIKRPIHENMTFAEYLDINVPPTKESIKRKQDRAIINRLKDYKIPIIQEIAKLRFQRSIMKKSSKKSIEEQYIDLFRDSSYAGKVITLFKSQVYINNDEKWIGKTSLKGELKAAYEVLKSNDILRDGKTTTQARVFYKRFKYDAVYDERTLRNNLKDDGIINGFNTLFTPLFKK